MKKCNSIDDVIAVSSDQFLQGGITSKLWFSLTLLVYKRKQKRFNNFLYSYLSSQPKCENLKALLSLVLKTTHLNLNKESNKNSLTIISKTLFILKITQKF